MSKFKIGDKVEFFKYNGEIEGKKKLLGKIFVVGVVNEEDDTNWYSVRGERYRYREEEIKMVGFVENQKKEIEFLGGDDKISKPSHYCFSKIEPIDVIQEWKLNFCLGNALKYISRAGKKGDKIEDLRKAIQYLEFEIKDVEGENK